MIHCFASDAEYCDAVDYAAGERQAAMERKEEEAVIAFLKDEMRDNPDEVLGIGKVRDALEAHYHAFIMDIRHGVHEE